MAEETKEKIINEPFDIVDYGLSDNDIDEIEVIDGSELTIYCTDDFRFVELYKDDAIAIAKALGVTAEDLL